MLDFSVLPGPMWQARIESPVGVMTGVASQAGVRALLWDHGENTNALDEVPQAMNHIIIEQLAEQLAAYFDGKQRNFDVPLDLHGTPFQQRVWTLLQTIPYGETRSYGDLARELGGAKLSRAVGAANGNNPVSVVVPCHRVIGASGALTGYAGGKAAKAFLLRLEGTSGGQMDLFGA